MGGIPPEVESAVFPLPPLPPTPASLSPRLMAPPVPVFDVPAVDVFAFSTPESPASVLLAILELPSPPNRLSRSELEQPIMASSTMAARPIRRKVGAALTVVGLVSSSISRRIPRSVGVPLVRWFRVNDA